MKTARDRLFGFMVFLREITGVQNFSIAEVMTICEYLGLVETVKLSTLYVEIPKGATR